MTIAGRLTYTYNRELRKAFPGLFKNSRNNVLTVLFRFSHKHLVFNLVNLVLYYLYSCDSGSVCTQFRPLVKREDS